MVTITQWMGGWACVLVLWAPLPSGFNFKSLSLEGTVRQLWGDSQILLNSQVCCINLMSLVGSGERTREATFTHNCDWAIFLLSGTQTQVEHTHYLGTRNQAIGILYMNYCPKTVAGIPAPLHWVPWGPVLFVIKQTRTFCPCTSYHGGSPCRHCWKPCFLLLLKLYQTRLEGPYSLLGIRGK